MLDKLTDSPDLVGDGGKGLLAHLMNHDPFVRDAVAINAATNTDGAAALAHLYKTGPDEYHDVLAVAAAYAHFHAHRETVGVKTMLADVPTHSPHLDLALRVTKLIQSDLSATEMTQLNTELAFMYRSPATSASPAETARVMALGLGRRRASASRLQDRPRLLCNGAPSAHRAFRHLRRCQGIPSRN